MLPCLTFDIGYLCDFTRWIFLWNGLVKTWMLTFHIDCLREVLTCMEQVACSMCTFSLFKSIHIKSYLLNGVYSLLPFAGCCVGRVFAERSFSAGNVCYISWQLKAATHPLVRELAGHWLCPSLHSGHERWVHHSAQVITSSSPSFFFLSNSCVCLCVCLFEERLRYLFSIYNT